jgi:hypothetical protein
MHDGSEQSIVFGMVWAREVHRLLLPTLAQVRDVSATLASGPAACISVFAGRIADTGCDPVSLPLGAIALPLGSRGPHCRLSSLRNHGGPTFARAALDPPLIYAICAAKPQAYSNVRRSLIKIYNKWPSFARLHNVGLSMNRICEGIDG